LPRGLSKIKIKSLPGFILSPGFERSLPVVAAGRPFFLFLAGEWQVGR
jgi:hypothetical protein